jgi:hypothetical protein
VVDGRVLAILPSKKTSGHIPIAVENSKTNKKGTRRNWQKAMRGVLFL